MKIQCFGCGKFIKLGTGKVAKVTDPKYGSIQYFCEPCVEERMEYKRREKGPGASFNDYIGLNKIVEFI